MRTVFTLPLIILIFFALGCGVLGRLRQNSTENANANRPAASPTATATPTPAAPEKSPEAFDRNSPGRDWLAFGAGAVIVAKTSEDTPNPARYLIDEAGFGWSTGEGQIQNQSVTLELPARTTLKTIVFDTHQPTYYDGRGAKDVTVEVSDESAASGFQTVLETTLTDSANKNGADDQSFPVQKEIAGRYVRYTAKNNHGSPAAIFTKELSGYGEQEPRAQIPNVSGTYKMESVSVMHLKQEGSAIIGCYEYDRGMIEGTIDGRTMTLVGTEATAAAKGEKSSFVAVNVADDGKTLLTTWWGWSATPKEKSYDRFYLGEKISDKIGSCPQMPDLDGTKDAAREKLEKELEENGKAILYGINFDFNSDVIKPESKPTLDKVTAILKAKPDWKFSVDGHTDNIGGEAFNQTLSDKRAASVVRYLTEAGIEAGRLTSKGYGLTRPLVPNNSEAERAQNRRVELIKE